MRKKLIDIIQNIRSEELLQVVYELLKDYKEYDLFLESFPYEL